MENGGRRKGRRLIIAARVLAVLWAGGWTSYVLGTELIRGGSLVEALRPTFWIGPAQLMIALIALRWQMLGGILLILMGVSWSITYAATFGETADVVALAILAFGVPPLAAGILLLVGSRKARESTT